MVFSSGLNEIIMLLICLYLIMVFNLHFFNFDVVIKLFNLIEHLVSCTLSQGCTFSHKVFLIFRTTKYFYFLCGLGWISALNLTQKRIWSSLISFRFKLCLHCKLTYFLPYLDFCKNAWLFFVKIRQVLVTISTGLMQCFSTGVPSNIYMA